MGSCHSVSNNPLDKAVKQWRKKLDRYPVGSQNRSLCFGMLAIVLDNRFKQLADMEDLEEAITYYRESLVLCPYQVRSTLLVNLATAVSTRFNHRGQLEDLEEAITCHRQALDLFPPGHPDRSTHLNNLATTVSTRFEHQGQIEDLEEAIVYLRQTLDLRPLGHPGRSTSLNNLAAVVSTRFEHRGQVKDLEDAITWHRQALDLRPPGHPSRSGSLNNLAADLDTRFKHQGRIEDLDEAITCLRQAFDLCPPGHPDRSNTLNNLASTVSSRFKYREQIEDLEDAIAFYREALDLRPPGRPDRSTSLNNLAVALFTRFKHRGQIEDLEEAIACLRQTFDLPPLGQPGRSTLHNLAALVSIRFDHLGQIDDLEEAITRHRQALYLFPPGHTDRPASLDNLAATIITRFRHRGQIEDLEEAIACQREALDLHPPGHHAHSAALNNLAVAISTRFHHLGQIEDLEEAITCHRQALDLRPPGHPGRPTSLSNLGLAVSRRFGHWGQVDDMEEAITCHRQALDFFPPGHIHRCSSLGNLASSVFVRFHHWGQIEDLEEAIKHFSEAEDTLPDPHPLHADLRSTLADIHLLRHKSHPQPDDCLSDAFRLLESAANHSTASSTVRFNIALNWAQEAQSLKHCSTLKAYSTSLTLLDRHLSLIPDIESQQHLLATTPPIVRSLASDAAAAAIAAGQLETAVELLEQGRAVLWSKLRGYRHPLEQLRDIDRQLGQRFEALSGQLEHHAMSAQSELTSPELDTAGPVSADLDAKMRQHRKLSEEWDNVVERIRQIEGFAHFLRAVPFATLRLAAVEGPVVVVNISEYRSDAIILHGMGSPVLVPLPYVSPKQLATLSLQLLDARVKQSSKKIAPILRSLWDTLVHLVTDKLATLGVAEKSRIWWCPTSELCALPLHAAGPYTSGKKNLPDLYISSYTPTLSTLIRARSGIVPSLTTPNLLVMGQPGDQDTAGELPNVTDEIRRISNFGNFSDVLVAGKANRKAVLSGLQQHDWIHFACHGHLVTQPFHSYFQLHNNERLTLLDLIQARLPSAEFAFLSACHSAAGDIHGTPDEVIHLAAAVQFSGFRSVVGTLWGMADMDGPHIAQAFYGHMFRHPGGMADFRDSAAALNVATRALRQRKGVTMDRWINFVHIGA